MTRIPRCALMYCTDEEIARLVAAFEAASIPRAEWTHAAHLTVALALMVKYPGEEGARRVREGILRLNAANGVAQTPTGGFHETLTAFYIAVVREFIADAGDGSLHELAAEMCSRYEDRALPLRYYSRERLFSWEARVSVVDPDLQPLPALSSPV